MREYEEEEDIEENPKPNSSHDEKEDISPNDKDLPKRVLAFSSKKLLRLFEKHLKTSVDGTFKSSCFLWYQQLRCSVKLSGYWIPVVWGWLPDKSLTSYKVIFLIH